MYWIGSILAVFFNVTGSVHFSDQLQDRITGVSECGKEVW